MFKNKLFLLFLGLTLLAVIFSFLASSWPDGLETVAGELGFEQKTITLFKSPIPDYVVPVADGGPLGGWLAAGAGVLIIFLIFQVLGYFLGRKLSGRTGN